jgi:two-component system nitrate/nitrite response regulator NarL
MHGVSTLLVERNTLFREGLGKLLANTGFTVTTMASCAEDIEADNPGEPQLIIVGFKYNHSDNEKNLTKLRSIFPESRLVVLADEYCHEHVHAAFRLSVRGYLMKDINFSALLKSLELIMLGEAVFPSAILTHKVDERDLKLSDDIISVVPPTLNSPRILSKRETDILQCLVQGQSNKIIARNLNIVDSTVKVHLKAILRKIRVQNRTQAAIWAVNHQDSVPRIDDASAQPVNGAHGSSLASLGEAERPRA